MKYLLYMVAVVVLLGINVGVFPSLKLMYGMPNLLMLFVMVLSLEVGDRDYLPVAFAAGLFLDFYSGVPVGGFALAFMLLGLIMQAVSSRYLVLELNWKNLLAFMAASYVFTHTFIWLYSTLLHRFGLTQVVVEFPVLWQKLLPELLYNALLLFPIYWLAELLKTAIARLTRRTYVG